MSLKKNLHWALYILFVAACAKQAAPTGGPKDSIPPILVESFPKNEAIKFKGNAIELTFSEFVSLHNPKEQIIITPTVGKNYEINTKKNQVTIHFEKDLKDSTTYTFNFRDAVQDITEKNPARNLQVAFSTGPYIDSLSIEGTITDLLSEKQLKDVTVALQDKNDTFNIMKHTPVYFTKTDLKGRYKISNLKPGVYEFYAVDDKNKNLIVDSKSEQYGFLKDYINLTKDTTGISIGLIRLDTRPLKITSARPYNTYFNIRASKTINNAQITAADTSHLVYTLSEDYSNIQVYNTIGERDSLQIRVALSDSIQNVTDTTVYAKFNKTNVTPEKFSTEVLSTTLLPDKGLIFSNIKFSKPLSQTNFDSLYFIVDSLNTISFTKENLTYDELTRVLHIEKKLDKKLFEESQPNLETDQPKQKRRTNYKLYLGTGAFISIEQDTSKSSSLKVESLKTEELGTILSEVRTSGNNFIIQLVDKDLKVIQSFANRAKATFEDLPPGEYLLRIILDKNNNGVWDPGNYLKREEPEKIKYYQNERGVKTINLKANFEIGPLLITY